MLHISKLALKRWAAFMLAAAMAVPCAVLSVAVHGGAGDMPIEIYLNGTRLESDVAPVLKEDRTFVPVRVIGEALGFAVGYSDGLVTFRHGGLGTEISMTVGDPVAYVDGRRIELPVPTFIEDGRTMAPVRFLSEALDSRVDWVPGYGAGPDSVVIHCPHPVDTSGGRAKIATRVEERRWELAGGYSGTVEIYYDLCIPVFTIPGDEAFASMLNESIDSLSEFRRNAIEEVYKEQLGVSPEYLGSARYDAYEEFSYRVVGGKGHVLSMKIEGYSYYGGAHGMPFWSSLNIDFAQSKALALPDLFKPGEDYKATLFREMGALRQANPEEYDGVEEASHIDDSSFYFEGGDLVLYYHPYDLSYYARGFVEFRIPLGRLAGQLKDEYL